MSEPTDWRHGGQLVLVHQQLCQRPVGARERRLSQPRQTVTPQQTGAAERTGSDGYPAADRDGENTIRRQTGAESRVSRLSRIRLGQREQGQTVIPQQNGAGSMERRQTEA